MNETHRKARPLSKVSNELFREATNTIRELIDERLPLHFGPNDLWGPVAHGFLARTGALLDSITLLAESNRSGESQVLLRVLFEHVTVFCWIAIDPDSHLPQWKDWADSRLYKLHMEARDFEITVLSQKEVAETRTAKPARPLPQLAREVDTYWAEQSTAFRPLNPTNPHILTFTGFYTTIYRPASNLVHADLFSVDRFASMPLVRQATVHREEKRGVNSDFPALAVPLTGFLLFAFSHHFSWPDRATVDQINAKLMYYD